jgi:5-methylcytosine-specific restriction endonuclease McrA
MRRNNTEFQKIKNVILFIHGYECFVCNAVSINNHVHHIDQNNGNNDPFNLLPLCPDCHRMVHKLVNIKVHFEDETVNNALLKLKLFF